MKKIIISIYILLTGMCLIFAEPLFLSIKEIECDTPELAINEFISGLQKRSIEKMLSVTAINEISDKYDFKKMCIRLNALNINFFKAPNNSEIYKTINRMDAIGYFGKQIKILTYSLLTDIVFDGTIVSPIDEESIDGILKSVNTERLSNIALIRIDFPIKSIELNERFINNSMEMAIPFGAETSTERIVLIYFENMYFYFGFHFLKYGNAWKIDSLNSNLAGTSVYGNAEKISRDEYEDLVNG